MSFYSEFARIGAMILVTAFAALLSVLPSDALATEPVPLSEYGKLPDVERAALSPSGDRVALVTSIDGNRVLLGIERESKKPISVTRVEDLKIRGIEWIDETRILLFASTTIDLPFNFTTDKFETSLARVIPMDGTEGGGIVFAKQERYYSGIFGRYGIRQINGETYGFFGGIEYKRNIPGSGPRWVFGHGRPHLFKVNFSNFEVSKMDRSAEDGASKDWLIDASGDLAFTLDVNDNSGSWQLSNARGKTILKGQQRAGRISLVGLNFDGSKAILVERGDIRQNWFEIGQEGGEPTPFLDDVEFERLFFDPQTGHLMGYTIGSDENERHVFSNESHQKKAEAVRKAFAQYESWMADWTSDLSTVIVRTSGNKDSGSYFTVDLKTNRAGALAYERDSIGPDQVGPISTFEYTARDGLEMDGVLTLPPGKEPKDLPVVMLPHGGPHSADRPVFDWWAQAFASRGYAVFQPNFRGSTNRSAAFRLAGYGEWGRKMQTDKTDGLMALAEAGIVDASRACIVGASYGGYAALAGVTIEQGIYKCAVAVAPVSDIRAVYREGYRATGRERTTKVALREQLGDPDLWDDVSPRRLAERADAPIMLIHGVDDTVVLYEHSTKMADKLKDAGKPYELVTLQGEDHWFSLSETRMQMLENSVRWVETHNPAD